MPGTTVAVGSVSDASVQITSGSVSRSIPLDLAACIFVEPHDAAS